MNFTKLKQTNNGITLIALVVIIIVLLILAGVTIATLTGDNGILTRATEAKKNIEMSEIKEKAELIKQDMFIDTQKERSTLKRSDLVEGINTELDGMREGYSSIVEDGKYIVKVDQELTITVQEYTGEYLEEGELGIILNYTPTQNEVEAVKVTLEVKIGGMATYEDYAQEILEDKTQEEKEQYFVEYYRTYMQNQYPDYEVNLENILKYYFNDRYATLEDYYKSNGYDSLDEFLIGRKMVENQEYLNKKIAVTLPSGKSSTLSLLYPTTTFTVYVNGTYTAKAVYDGQTVEKSIETTNIRNKIVYDLPKENENTYTISCIEDLVGLSLNVNNCIDTYEGKTIKILKDLDFNQDSSYKNPNDTSLGDINNDGKVEAIKTEVTTGEGFTSIGLGYRYDSTNQISFNRYFYGNLDGNNKTISNLYINKTELDTSTTNYIGLFGYFGKSGNDSELKDLTLTGTINVHEERKSRVCLGGFVGYKYGNAVIQNCQGDIDINVSTIVPNLETIGVFENFENNVGGIIGYATQGNITNCINNGEINVETNGATYIGGIAGYAPSIQIIESTNNGKTILNHIGLSEETEYVFYVHVGNITGYTSSMGSISSCNNYGEIQTTYSRIEGDIYVGGIVGYNTGTVSLCNNYNNVSIGSTENGDALRPYIGGISGYNTKLIEKCSNSGNITNSGAGKFIYVAGICGMNYKAEGIKQSYNIGDILNDGNSLEKYGSACQIGGIVCSNSGDTSKGSTVENCYNIGTITNKGQGNQHGGGLASYNASLSVIKNSYNIGNLTFTGTKAINAGAICNSATTTSVQNCYYLQGTYSKGTNGGEIGTTVKLESEMKTEAFVNLLHGNQTETIWKIVTGQNNGYPILSWQE